MGDSYEFTTWPKHQNIYYKVTSESLVFSVKGERNAAVGLAKEPGKCLYWILIGYNQKCCIRTYNGQNYCSVLIKNFLSTNKYTQFWLTWRNGTIIFGKSKEVTPILERHTPARNLQYVTFCVLGEMNPIHWMCQLPPKIETPELLRLTGGEPHWVKADDQLPDEAMIGGYEVGVLYIIRAFHQGSLVPGKFVPALGLGFVPWGGEMHEKNKFEVLCGFNCKWIKTVKNEIPVGAVEAGFSEDGHEILYIGRALCDNYLIPGKVQPSHNCCYIPYNGKEIAYGEYEILVLPHIMTQSAHNFYLPSFRNVHDDNESPRNYSESEEEAIFLRDDDDDGNLYMF